MKGVIKSGMLASVIVLIMVVIACTTSEAELIQGILQNVDSVNGKVTVATKDGRTVNLEIATETPVETEGAPSTLDALEPGASVEVEVGKGGQVARHIKARQAKVEGVIVEITMSEQIITIIISSACALVGAAVFFIGFKREGHWGTKI